MSYKKLVPIIYLKDTKAYSDEALTNLKIGRASCRERV